MSEEPTALDISSSSSSSSSSCSSASEEVASVRHAAAPLSWLEGFKLAARELGLSFGATDLVALSSESDDDDGLDVGAHRLWADMIEEEEAEQQRIAAEERLERGKKLFVGGLTLTGADATPGVEELGGYNRLAVALFAVWRMLCHVADSELVRLKVCLDRQFVFGVFSSRNRAFAAIRALKVFEARKALIAEQEAFLTNELHLEPELVAQCLPKPSMYCRWPRNYVVSLIKTQAKIAKSSKRAATNATPTTKNKSIVKKQKQKKKNQQKQQSRPQS